MKKLQELHDYKDLIIRSDFVIIFFSVIVICILPGCNRPVTNRVQGYIEGEFVYVASPLAGALEALQVHKGAQVNAGDPLFILDSAPEIKTRDEAQQRVKQARSNVNDAKKGKRPSEIEAIEAQLRQLMSTLALSEKELDRQEILLRSKATSAQDVDRARSTLEQNRQRVAQVKADLKTAKLGSRNDQLEAAEANMRAMEAALSKAEWDLSQKQQSAQQAAMVFDTLYREGEWVAAGRPVVVLLPPQNIKVRAFVPENQIAKVHPGDTLQVFVDGLRWPLIAKVSFISPQAEYTPPVIYSKDSRGKLVFMIEAVFDAKTAANLHPGQPVDVQLGP